MKKFIFAFTVGYISTLALSTVAHAQTSVNTEIPELKINVASIQKEISPGNANTANLAGIKPKALKDFAKNFKNVKVEYWEKITDGFTAKFNDDGVNNWIYYDPRGLRVGSLKGYNESKLPKEIRKIIKQVYYDYAITYVQEVQTIESEGIPTYIIHLEDKDNILQVRIYDGQMEEWKKLKKSSN